MYNKYWGSTNYIYNKYWGVQIPGSTYYMLHRHQKDKTNLDLLEQEIVSGSGISWAMCKSAP